MSQIKSYLTIRWMIKRDISDVVDVDRESFEEPWNTSQFNDCMDRRDVICLVAASGDKAVGFVIYQLLAGEIAILRIAVSEHVRLTGVGRQLISKIANKLGTLNRSRITVTIIDNNLPAHLFFRALGFQAVDVLRNYLGSGDDAYFMQFKISWQS